MFHIRIAAVVAIGSLVTGCYTLQPVTGEKPMVGSRVAFDVNDVGRVALGGSIGPEISNIEGRLVATENGDYLLAVSSIRFLRGGEQTWTGERVNIKSEYVGRTFERRFSKGRTIALTATLIGATAFIAFGSDLLGLGSLGDDSNPRPDPDPTELVRRRP